jgi:hypothetical protein
MVSYLLTEFRHEPAPSVDPHARAYMRTVLLACLLILVSPGSRGADLPDLYVGEAVVADQGGAERARALPLALEHVLRKLSGLRVFDDYPLVGPALDRAPEMVLSYHYRKDPDPSDEDGASPEWRLVAHFDEKAVDEMARALQLPLWQPQRRPLTAWLIIDDGLDRRILPIEFGDAKQAMDTVAEQRGLPLAWPSPDAEGQYAVDEQILWGGYTEDLEDSRGEGVLIAAARREGPEWGVRINVGFQGQHWTWRVNNIDLPSALAEGMEQAVDQVAAVNTIAASDLGASRQELTVQGLLNAADYQRCLAYLQNISLVDEVVVVAARPGSVTFSLELNALPRYLEELLDGGGVLQREDEGNRYLLVRTPPDGG